MTKPKILIFKCPHCASLDRYPEDKSDKSQRPPCYVCGEDLLVFDHCEDDPLDTGTALAIVHAIALQALEATGDYVPATSMGEARAALAVVEDLIVNNFGEE